MMSASSFLQLYSDDDIILLDDNQTFSKKEILSYSDKILKNVIYKDIVLICFSNNIESYVLYICLIYKGAIPILLEEKSEISWLNSVIDKFKPSFIISDSGSLSALNLNEDYNFNGRVISKRIHNSSGNKEIHSLLTTSGSTGEPKFAVISEKNINFVVSGICKYLKLDKKDRAITTLPLNYSYGLSILLSHLNVGGSIFVTDKGLFDKHFWNQIKDNNITSFNGVPFHFQQIIKLKIDLSQFSLRYITQAGGKLESEKILEFLNLSIKKVPFFVMYGQTECSPRISYLPPEQIEKKLGSVGVPIPGGEIFIFDSDKNGIGEIVYKGDNIFMGYADSIDFLNNPNYEKIQQWHTGDLGYIDPDGYLFITGRKKRFIKLFGKRYNLDSLKSQFIGKVSIEFELIEIDDDLVIVFSAEDISKSEDHNLLTKLISRHLNVPKKTIQVKFVNHFTYNSNNKINYNELKNSTF